MDTVSSYNQTRFLKPAAVFIISLFFNWLVQLSYYILVTIFQPGAFAGQKNLLQYLTGVLGDGLIVPLINVIIFSLLSLLNLKVRRKAVVITFIFALITDFLTHFFQAKLGLVNWSMPQPYRWNFAGYWHMISLPIQMTYLYYFFYIMVVKWKEVKSNVVLKRSVAGIFGLMLLFLVLFFYDHVRV